MLDGSPASGTAPLSFDGIIDRDKKQLENVVQLFTDKLLPFRAQFMLGSSERLGDSISALKEICHIIYQMEYAEDTRDTSRKSTKSAIPDACKCFWRIFETIHCWTDIWLRDKLRVQHEHVFQIKLERILRGHELDYVFDILSLLPMGTLKPPPPPRSRRELIDKVAEHFRQHMLTHLRVDDALSGKVQMYYKGKQDFAKQHELLESKFHEFVANGFFDPTHDIMLLATFYQMQDTIRKDRSLWYKRRLILSEFFETEGSFIATLAQGKTTEKRQTHATTGRATEGVAGGVVGEPAGTGAAEAPLLQTWDELKARFEKVKRDYLLDLKALRYQSDLLENYLKIYYAEENDEKADKDFGQRLSCVLRARTQEIPALVQQGKLHEFRYLGVHSVEEFIKDEIKKASLEDKTSHTADASVTSGQPLKTGAKTEVVDMKMLKHFTSLQNILYTPFALRAILMLSEEALGHLGDDGGENKNIEVVFDLIARMSELLSGLPECIREIDFRPFTTRLGWHRFRNFYYHFYRYDGEIKFVTSSCASPGDYLDLKGLRAEILWVGRVSEQYLGRVWRHISQKESGSMNGTLSTPELLSFVTRASIDPIITPHGQGEGRSAGDNEIDDASTVSRRKIYEEHLMTECKRLASLERENESEYQRAEIIMRTKRIGELIKRLQTGSSNGAEAAAAASTASESVVDVHGPSACFFRLQRGRFAHFNFLPSDNEIKSAIENAHSLLLIKGGSS